MSRRAPPRRSQPSAAEIGAASDAFRRAHDLLSAEEMEAWLAQRDLTPATWHALVRRALGGARRGLAPAGAAYATPEVVALMAAAAAAARRSKYKGPDAAGRPSPARAEPSPSRPHVVTRLGMDCGAAAVAALCRCHGIEVSLGDARRAVGSDATGTTLIGIVRGTRALGLDTRAVKSSKRNLPTLPLPAVVHVDGNHWMVLYGAGAQHVELSDPAAGPLRLSRAEFQARWSGYAVLVDQATTSSTMSTSR